MRRVRARYDLANRHVSRNDAMHGIPSICLQNKKVFTRNAFKKTPRWLMRVHKGALSGHWSPRGRLTYNRDQQACETRLHNNSNPIIINRAYYEDLCGMHILCTKTTPGVRGRGEGGVTHFSVLSTFKPSCHRINPRLTWGVVATPLEVKFLPGDRNPRGSTPLCDTRHACAVYWPTTGHLFRKVVHTMIPIFYELSPNDPLFCMQPTLNDPLWTEFPNFVCMVCRKF